MISFISSPRTFWQPFDPQQSAGKCDIPKGFAMLARRLVPSRALNFQDRGKRGKAEPFLSKISA
jgi:hypothetical protein